MLSPEALECATPLTEILDSRRLTVTPIVGTPLEKLVTATRADSNFMGAIPGGDSGQLYTPDAINIAYIANVKDSVFNASPHDIAMDDVTEVVIKAVQGHMTHARTIVAPAVAELVAKVGESLMQLTPSKMLGMEVVVWSPPKPMENSSLETMVRKFEETPFDMPALRMKAPNITSQEITDLMKTGTAGLDRDIAEWVAIQGESFFINIWESIFQIKQAPLNERFNVGFNDFTEDRECGVDNALAIFLIARRLAEEPLPGTEMNISAFTTIAVEFRNQAGARLCRALDYLDENLKSGTLVLSTTQNKTVVNGAIYRKWIEDGGENEILFGNLLDHPPVFNVALINEKADALKIKWNNYATLTATVESNRRFNKTKEVLHYEFEKQIREIPDGEEATVANRDMVLKQFEVLLGTVRESELSDLWALCLRLVCGSRFARTDAERILSGIERVKKENPSVDVREAAAVSVIEYIAYWVSTQFKVTAI